MRAFIAVDLPLACQQAVGTLQATLRQSLDPLPCAITWVQPTYTHLTLRFFADLPDDRVTHVHEAMTAATARSAPFELSLGRLGMFPDEGRPTVLWLGCAAGEQKMCQFEAMLSKELASRGWPAEERAFHPHLTLGRVKRRGPPNVLRKALATYQPAGGTVQLAVDHVTLIQSVLGAAGPHYTPLVQSHLIQQ